MKLSNIYMSVALAAAMCACDAHVDSDSLGGMVPAEQIAANLEVRGITPGSNKIILKNNNMGVGGMWDYLVGVSTAQCDTVLIPFLGEQTLTFYATCGGGQVEVKCLRALPPKASRGHGTTYIPTAAGAAMAPAVTAGVI